MKKSLKLKDLFVGKTDAKNELINNTLAERERFIDSFLIPENINTDDFINGQRTFVTGLKGTGKTALLRYLSLLIEKSNKAKTAFILFKSDFSEEDKAAFSHAANTFVTVKNEDSDFEEDFTNVWQWFLHRNIVRISKANNNIFFYEDNTWDKYVKCINAPKLGNDESGLHRLLPKLKKGNVEIEGDTEFIKSKLGLEFDWDDNNKNHVKFSSIARQANELYKKLRPKPNKLIIFIDELELTLSKSKQYQKDIKLVRDLIIGVNNLNVISKLLNYNIHFITAVRGEVLTSIQSSGKEINKPIMDFGVNLKWQQSGDSIKNHPLIKVINKKIQSTEKQLGFDVISSDEEIWLKYFPSKIRNHSAQDYILHRTWYRPRDIIRILNLAQQQFPNETSFNGNVFEAITKEYSTQSWIEHAEELRTSFSITEIEGIKKLLTSLKCPFTFNQILDVSETKRKYYSDVDQLLNKYKIGDILSILYRVGIIGNTGQKVRYSFRGDDELVIENKMKVHDPLWSYLSIISEDNRI